MANFIANPPPYLGQRDDVPIAALKGPYCQYLKNANVQNGKVSIRKADSSFTSSLTSVTGLANYKTGGQFIATTNIGGANALKVLDITAGGAGTNVYNPVVGSGFTFTNFNEFNGSFYIWGDGTMATLGGVYYNLSTTSWGSTPYTLPANFTPIASITFKRRHYILKNQGTVVAYSGLDQITGTLSTRDHASQLTFGGYFLGIKSVSLSDNQSAEKFLVLISNQGEVLAYRGSFMDGSDWELAYSSVIPAPLGNNSFIDYRGDVIVITEAGLYSLRDLFLKGNQLTLEDIALSAPIKNRWAQIVSGFSAYQSRLARTAGIYDQAKSRILVLFELQIDFDSGLTVGSGRGMWLIYDINSKAWMEHDSGSGTDNGATNPAYFGKNVYYALSSLTVYKKEGASNSSGVTMALRSAPLDVGKFGVNRGCGIELLMASDQYAGVGVGIILDLGRESASGPTITDPNSGGGVVKNLYDVGGEGSYVQYSISCTASSGSVGFDLYGTNYWNITGDAPR